MVLIWDITHHIKPILCYILPLYCHIYGKDTYFIKIHTIPIHGNDMGYENGIPIPNPCLWERSIHIELFLLGEIKVWG